MLYDISHKTTFSYEEIVSVSHHVLHLTPRVHPQQTCLVSETIVEPKPAIDSSGQDYFGNPIRHLTVQRKRSRSSKARRGKPCANGLRPTRRSTLTSSCSSRPTWSVTTRFAITRCNRSRLGGRGIGRKR